MSTISVNLFPYLAISGDYTISNHSRPVRSGFGDFGCLRDGNIRGIVFKNPPLLRTLPLFWRIFSAEGRKKFEPQNALKNGLKTLKKPTAGGKILRVLTIIKNSPLILWGFGNKGGFLKTIPLISIFRTILCKPCTRLLILTSLNNSGITSMSVKVY